jgi:V/A-type H+-transporting ATPase subunit D
MPDREVTPTHSAFLELKEERMGMREGYSFLDEKRLILASEMLSELQRYQDELAGFEAFYAKASVAFRAAVGRHGLQGLTLYPPAAGQLGAITLNARSVLGVTIQEVECELQEEEPPSRAVDESPEAERCRDLFGALIPRAARLAALVGNLERLRLEYLHTARRARALEDVLLPEIDETLKVIDAALEELEREEAVRVRQMGGRL